MASALCTTKECYCSLAGAVEAGATEVLTAEPLLKCMDR
jgi:hypothetical protein